MSTELTNWISASKNLPVLDDEALGAALVDAGDANSNGAGINFLDFSGKTGKWGTGANKDAVDPEDLFIVEPATFTEGWTFWLNGKVPQGGKHEWLASQRATKTVYEDDLEDPSNGARLDDGDGWKPSAGFSCITPLNEPYKHNLNSKSGVGGIAALMKESGKRGVAKEPNIPVLTLDQETFQAQGKTNWKPLYVVEAWVYRATMMAYANGEIDLDQLLQNDAKPKKKAGKKRGK
jgi:hypothetical protein